MRTFSLDRIHPLSIVAEPAREIPKASLDAHFEGGYGIFAGPATKVAVLRFTSRQARWVADERWHPEQQGTMLAAGGYELRVPYADPRELIMHVLQYSPEVEVIEPASLRCEVAERARQTAAIYLK